MKEAQATYADIASEKTSKDCPATSEAMEKVLREDGIKYKEKYNVYLQYSQSRSQHHLHKRGHGSNKREVPRACRPKSGRNECKHEAPWTKQMNEGAPLVMCPGLAKTHELPCSGRRNWVGQILGTRNEEWLTGTMGGMSVALGGSNSNVKPNDRVPILPCTHEHKCLRKCIK